MVFHSFNDAPEHEIAPGYRVQVMHSANTTLTYLKADAGAALAEDVNAHEQVSTLLEGEFEFTVAGETRRMTAGDVAILAPNTKHSGVAITNCKILNIFSPSFEEHMKTGSV